MPSLNFGVISIFIGIIILIGALVLKNRHKRLKQKPFLYSPLRNDVTCYSKDIVHGDIPTSKSLFKYYKVIDDKQQDPQFFSEKVDMQLQSTLPDDDDPVHKEFDEETIDKTPLLQRFL